MSLPATTKIDSSESSSPRHRNHNPSPLPPPSHQHHHHRHKHYKLFRSGGAGAGRISRSSRHRSFRSPLPEEWSKSNSNRNRKEIKENVEDGIQVVNIINDYYEFDNEDHVDDANDDDDDVIICSCSSSSNSLAGSDDLEVINEHSDDVKIRNIGRRSSKCTCRSGGQTNSTTSGSSKSTSLTSSSANSSRRSSSSDSQFLLSVKPSITLTPPSDYIMGASSSIVTSAGPGAATNAVTTPIKNSSTPTDPYYTFFHHEDRKMLPSITAESSFRKDDIFHFPSENMPQFIENVLRSKKPQYDAKLMKKLSKCIILPEDPSDPTAFTVTPGLTRPPKPPWCSSKPVQKIVGTFAILMSLGIFIAILYVHWCSDTFRPMMKK